MYKPLRTINEPSIKEGNNSEKMNNFLTGIAKYIIKEVSKPETSKKLKQLFFASVYAIGGVIMSEWFMFTGIDLLDKSGVPKHVLCLIGGIALLMIGFMSLKITARGVTKIMEN